MNKKMKKAIQSLPAMLAVLAVVCASLVSFTACSDDGNSCPEKDGWLLVTKTEFKASYVNEEVGSKLPIGKHDLFEMKYNEQGELAEYRLNDGCIGRFTYAEGKIFVQDDPQFGSCVHFLSPEGKVTETVYTDAARGKDKLTYNEKGQCVSLDYHGGQTMLYQWENDQVTGIDYRNQTPTPGCRIYYTDIPKKSNAPYLRNLMMGYCGYYDYLEISGHLNISSDKYLPAKVIIEFDGGGKEGYAQIFEATYDLNPDGTVKTMHFTAHDGILSSPEGHRLVYKGDVTYAYMTK